jgi:integrase/recombinase XerD
MPGRQAKLISERDIDVMLAAVSGTAYSKRDRAMILMSARAGLRACEIAGARWSMICDGRGAVTSVISISDAIAKKGSGRRIPLHPQLRAALIDLQDQHQRMSDPIIRSLRGCHMRPNSIVNWFVMLYRRLGLQGCSSHSGRRTFITRAARSAQSAGGCLRDVQLLAGHRSILVTQGYIEGDTDAQRRIVEML